MKQNLLFIYLLFFLFSAPSKAQDFQWVRQFGDQGTDEAEAIDVDSNGNSYSIGVAQSYTYDLDPTTNGTQIINNLSTPFSPFRDIYLVKLNANGNFVWGKTFGDIKYDQYAYDIKIGYDGNIYVFLQTTDSITNNQFDQFITIVKISPEGNELSRIKIKNPGSFFTYHFDIDNQNNILVSGWFVNSKTINFNNVNVKFESQNSIASYIFKLDNFGNFIWKKIFDTPQLSDVLFQTKPDGNIIAVLNSSDQGSPISSILNINTNNANVIWEKKLSQQAINTFHLDRMENIIIAGSNGVYQGTVDVDPSPNVVNTDSQKFLLWLDSNGNFLDLKEYFVSQFSADFRIWKIESDIQNNIYLVGDFAGKIDADPSSNVFFLQNPYGAIQFGSGYAIKFDSNRNFDKAYMLISNYRSLVKDIKVKNNSIYLLGDFNDQCDFDSGVGNQILSTLHDGNVVTTDGFVVKLSPCDPSKPDGEESQLFCTSQNATIGDLFPNFIGIQWYDNTTNGNILSPTTNLQGGKIYYASQTSNSCETERLAVTVSIVNTPPIPTANATAAFCKKENATLSDIQISGQNIQWYDTNVSTALLANTTLLEDNKTYYASQTIGCESDRTPVLVRIYDTPLPIANNNQQFCIDKNPTIANLTITASNIKWYDASTNGTLLSDTTPLQNGTTYYASQTISGCESERIPILINIQNTPAPTGNTNQTLCSSQNPTLETIVISGNEIKWYNSAGILLSNSTSLQDGVTYYASQTENNCESLNKLAVTISLINTLPANDYEELFCDDFNDGSEKVNLSDYDSKLISNTSGYTFSYYSTFLGAENQLIGNQINNFSSYSLTFGENKIYVRINSNTPCYAIVELKLTLVSKPIITIPDVVPICENNSITIDAGLGFDTYLWSTGATTSTIVVANAGNYSVIVTTNYSTISCSSTKNFEVRKSNIATITSVETQDWTDNQNTITIFASGEGDFEYSIDGTHFQDSNQFSALYSGEYTVHVRDKNGCGTATDEVFLLMYPKYFTPNGDGFNDSWNIKFSDLETNLSIKIFDRYGKLIKELIQNNDWNGTMNGYALPSDDYWFIATRADGNEYKGHFSLKR